MLGKSEGTNRAADQLEPLWRLWSDHSVDGVLWKLKAALRSKWSRLPTDLADECVSKALVDAAEALLKGHEIRNLPGWILKIAEKKAYAWYQDQKSLREHQDNVSISLHTERRCTGEIETYERRRKEAVTYALELAYELLPGVGRGKVLDVLEIFLEAVRDGIPDLPAQTVADTLNISPGAVRTLLSRGLARLRRAADRRGIRLPETLDPDKIDKYEPIEERLSIQIEEGEEK